MPSPVVHITQNLEPMGLDQLDLPANIVQNTWTRRHQNIISPAGYSTGRQLLKALEPEEWHSYVNKNAEHGHPKVIWLVDGAFLFNSMAALNKYISFAKFKEQMHVFQPITYIYQRPVITQDRPQEGLLRLLNTLRREKFHMVECPAHKTDGANYMAAYFNVHIMEAAFTKAALDVEHMLIVTNSDLILPAVNYVRENCNMKVSLGLVPKHNLSNFFMAQFDFIVRLPELLDYYDITAPRRSKEINNDIT